MVLGPGQCDHMSDSRGPSKVVANLEVVRAVLSEDVVSWSFGITAAMGGWRADLRSGSMGQPPPCSGAFMFVLFGLVMWGVLVCVCVPLLERMLLFTESLPSRS